MLLIINDLMPKQQPDKILELLQTLEEPYKTPALKLYKKYGKILKTYPASNKYHSNYPGGLYDHTLNVMICIIELYKAKKIICELFSLPVPFTLSECLYVAFGHDLGKEKQFDIKPYQHHTKWIISIFEHEKIYITDNIYNALLMHHGPYGSKGHMTPLARILYCADSWAAQVLEIKK